jgi:hypothetical protein
MTVSGECDHESYAIFLFKFSEHQIVDEIQQNQVLGASLLSTAHYECLRAAIGIVIED